MCVFVSFLNSLMQNTDSLPSCWRDFEKWNRLECLRKCPFIEPRGLCLCTVDHYGSLSVCPSVWPSVTGKVNLKNSPDKRSYIPGTVWLILSVYDLWLRSQRSQMSRSKVIWIRAKGQIRMPEKDKWAHNNVKLLHYSRTWAKMTQNGPK